MHRLSESDVVVTTTHSPSPEVEDSATQLARRVRRPLVARHRDTIHTLTRREGVLAALVVGPARVRLIDQGRGYGFHPSMARLRVSALRAGGGDRLVKVAGLRAGDSVLDCTCGLGADAIVAAHAVGENGIVVTLESSAMLAAMISNGMQHYDDGFAVLVRAMRRVTVINAEYEGLLPLLPAGSWDVVYFDPMFVSTIDEAKGLDLVRMLGSGGTPSRDVIAEARRVARRCVVVKDRAPGQLLRALDIPVVSRTQRIWYGRLDADEASQRRVRG